jgi:hypothetical protein
MKGKEHRKDRDVPDKTRIILFARYICNGIAGM